MSPWSTACTVTPLSTSRIFNVSGRWLGDLIASLRQQRMDLPQLGLVVAVIGSRLRFFSLAAAPDSIDRPCVPNPSYPQTSPIAVHRVSSDALFFFARPGTSAAGTRNAATGRARRCVFRVEHHLNSFAVLSGTA